MNNNEDRNKTVLGEDFDVFPKLDENDLKDSKDDYSESTKPKQEPQESAPPELTDLQKKVAGIDDQKWTVYLRAGGIAAGLLSSASLFLLPLLVEGTNTYGLIIASVIAFLGPGFAERKFGRSVNTGRKWLLITFGISLLLFLAYTIFVKGISFPA
ncbi:MAG: hypothetical protein BWY11_01966 [Firmicutes bacterium ADurb.Bin182]|nr:MAG: hypothetical protein BWY11_01966 [Firmicutes bacterium ADurb.Bin182]